jgi:hypothetical protein
MEHKAFSFDWNGFDRELRAMLEAALRSGATDELERYVQSNRKRLTDPYEGEPLPDDWRDMLEANDVHEFGDFALTRFYDPQDDQGLADGWLDLSDRLPEPAQAALLGFPFGPTENYFDPGRMGSYFQTPADITTSRATLETSEDATLADFRELLRSCARSGRGLYVKF